jgi:hypothetical protein
MLAAFGLAAALVVAAVFFLRRQARPTVVVLPPPVEAPVEPAPVAPAAPAAAPKVAAQAPPPAAPEEPPPEAPAAASGPCGAGQVPVGSGKHAYCVDRFEFPGEGQLPRTGVSRVAAAALCRARGARLCSDGEWERACRGPSRASYPYGAAYKADRCNTRGGEIAKAGAFADCKSQSGAFDMSGNAAEWTASGAVRGGATGEGDPAGRCSHRARVKGEAPALVGFRCCSDARR